MWKLFTLFLLESDSSEFQKDLIVWKRPSYLMNGANNTSVSEGLNSVETSNTAPKMENKWSVSEGLNSVETELLTVRDVIHERGFRRT